MNTTMHPSEVALAFGLALDAISNALKNGKIVNLDKLGKLYPSIKSKWTPTADGQELSNLDRRVFFRPSQAIISAIKESRITWVSDNH